MYCPDGSKACTEILYVRLQHTFHSSGLHTYVQGDRPKCIVM